MRIDFIGAPGTEKMTLKIKILKNTDYIDGASIWQKNHPRHQSIVNTYHRLTKLTGRMPFFKFEFLKHPSLERTELTNLVKNINSLISNGNWPAAQWVHNKDDYARKLHYNTRKALNNTTAADMESQKVILIDESMFYRISLFDGFAVNQKMMNEYYDLLPRPSALIHIKATTPLLVKRLVAEKSSDRKLMDRHKDRGDVGLNLEVGRSIDFARFAANYAKEKNIPLLEIEAIDDIEQKAKTVERFIEDLKNR